MSKYYGSIEAGGTKFVLAVGDEDYGIIKTHQIPTTHPEETISKTIAFFKENPVEAIGLGSFGPLDINVDSPTYGYITTTPKPDWGGINLLGKISDELNVPVAFTTDVNASAYGEMVKTGLQDVVYFTIGTGIGGGATQKKALLEGVDMLKWGTKQLNAIQKIRILKVSVLSIMIVWKVSLLDRQSLHVFRNVVKKLKRIMKYGN